MQNTLTSLEDKQLWITYSQETNRLSTGHPICNIANLMPQRREKLLPDVIHMLSNSVYGYKGIMNYGNCLFEGSGRWRDSCRDWII